MKRTIEKRILVQVSLCVCDVCGYEWMTGDEAKRCANCGSREWDGVKVRREGIELPDAGKIRLE